MNKSFYIVPVHNKEELIKSVLEGIVDNHQRNDDELNIICILDGCIDKTESIITDFMRNFITYEIGNFYILFQEDVHEIKCLNFGLQYIKNNLNPQPNDLIFMVQDDVIIEEKGINVAFRRLFEDRKDLGYVSMRLGVSLHVSNGEIKENRYMESEFGHWNQLNWKFHSTVDYGVFVESEIAIRSPTCTQWKRFEECGFFDENLAPCGYDCHDFSIRMNKAGYTNGIFALKFKSDVNWGTMRSDKPSNFNDKISPIYERNRKYVASKHSDYFGVIDGKE
jgi:hypothetical protein